MHAHTAHSLMHSPRVILSACQHRMGTFTPVWNDEGCHVTQRCAGGTDKALQTKMRPKEDPKPHTLRPAYLWCQYQ